MSFGDSVCEEVVIRKDFAAHQHECPLRPVTCSNGCGAEMAVRDDESHSCVGHHKDSIVLLQRENATLQQVRRENAAMNATWQGGVVF
jgi:hypothetical protein